MVLVKAMLPTAPGDHQDDNGMVLFLSRPSRPARMTLGWYKNQNDKPESAMSGANQDGARMAIPVFASRPFLFLGRKVHHPTKSSCPYRMISSGGRMIILIILPQSKAWMMMDFGLAISEWFGTT